MELIKGIIKIDKTDYRIYYLESISEELKMEIRNRLVAICHGADNTKSTSAIYSYKETVKEFLRRYSLEDKDGKKNKGLIGELLIHTIIEIEGDYVTASPFFNMEERSFKKGYDIALFEPQNDELWIAEVKSGQKQKNQKNASSAIVGLINTAKNDLNERLNDKDTRLWLNALNAAKVSMTNNSQQKKAVIELLENYANKAVDGQSKSNDYNVILSATLFHPMTERIDEEEVDKKYKKIVKEDLFKKVLVIAVQKNTFEAIYEFLRNEVEH